MKKVEITKSVKIKIILFVLALTIMGTGFTYAFMFRQSNTIFNKFIPSEVSCQINEIFDSSTGIKSSVTVSNTGKIDSYIRVTVVSNWVNEKGQITGKASEDVTFILGPDWISKGNNIYVYKYPVKPEESTKELLGSNIVLKTDGKFKQSVDIVAEAIQSNPVTAVTESWNVTVDSSGNIQ